MGEVEATRDKVTRHELRHDSHTVSLLTDHLVFSPKYRGKVLLGDVAEVVEEIVIDEEKENLERTKSGTYRCITNFLEGSIKNKKSKSFYISRIKR